jgi:phosphatidylglycerol:prolipoprotein diacylglycerol transferase
MMLGLAIGRIGCLMNGCCYGGVCENPALPSFQFPAGSPPYMQHVAYGDLLGLTTVEQKSDEQDGTSRIVTSVQPGSIADGLGIQKDDRIAIYAPDSQRVRFFKQHREQWRDDQDLICFIDSQRQGRMTVSLDELAGSSRPVHPTQIYSAINAGLLAVMLWFFWTVRKRDGEVFAWMLILYSIARFLLEIIRRDESGLFGTNLTISQWVSIGTIIAGFTLFSLARPLPASGDQLSPR